MNLFQPGQVYPSSDNITDGCGSHLSTCASHCEVMEKVPANSLEWVIKIEIYQELMEQTISKTTVKLS